VSQGVVAGFTTESVFRFLGGTYRSTYRPLNDAIIAGRLRGPRGDRLLQPQHGIRAGHLTIVKELLANDVLVVSTGCNSITCAKHGLMTPRPPSSTPARACRRSAARWAFRRCCTWAPAWTTAGY